MTIIWKATSEWQPSIMEAPPGFYIMNVTQFYIELFLTHDKPEIAFGYAKTFLDTYALRHIGKKAEMSLSGGDHPDLKGLKENIYFIYEHIAAFLIQNLGKERALKLMSAFICISIKKFLASEDYQKDYQQENGNDTIPLEEFFANKYKDYQTQDNPYNMCL